TTSTAWKTLGHANQLQAGDEVDIAQGTYPCQVTITVAGTVAHPVWIRSSDGPGKAVFDCTGQSFGFEIVHAKYVALDGLEIKLAQLDLAHGSPGNPPYTDLADHVLVIHNHLHHAGDACLKANQATYLDVVDNEADHPEAFGPSAGGQA